MKNKVISILLALVILQPSYAYLDPGTGSMLLSALIAIFASAFFGIKALYYKLSTLFLRIAGVKVDKTKHEIVFYSEGHTYWSTFKPIVEELLEAGQKVVFLTSSEKDPALALKHPLMETKYIGEGNKAFIYLSFIEAEVCVLTTPGLEVLQLKRSKGVKKYVHLLHSLSSVSLYKIFSFDYYDTILCSGHYQKNELRLLEERRGTKTKTLLDSGCPYIDAIFERKDNAQDAQSEISDKPTILIAPSWGQNGLLRHIPLEVLKDILNENVNVIIRPHPQSLISERDLIDDLQTNLKNYQNIEWDFTTDNFPSLAKGDLLISDFSGITFDFALVFEKPIITVKTDSNFDGVEHFDLQDRAIWEDEVIAKMGLRLKKDQLPSLKDHALSLLNNAEYIENIRHLKANEFYNLGNSKKIIAEQIKALVQEYKHVK